ncbi:MAG: hypothetical protein ABFR62_07730 [Bacteroidota bacterium]
MSQVKYFFLIISLAVSSNIKSQTYHTKIDDLIFYDDNEMELFSKIDSLNIDEDFILLGFSNSNDRYNSIKLQKEFVDKWISKHRDKVNKRSNNYEKAKYLIKKANKELFTKYSEKSNFYSLQQGRFDIDLAITTLSYSFSKLNIEYSLSETAIGIFIILGHNQQLYFISINDNKDIVILSKDDIERNIITYKLEAKLIDNDEIRLLSPELLADNVTSLENLISIKEYCAWLFSKKATDEMELEKYPEAINNLKKAYFIYQSPVIKSLLETTSLSAMQEGSYSTSKKIPFWADYINLSTKEEATNSINYFHEEERNNLTKRKISTSQYIAETDSLNSKILSQELIKVSNFNRNMALTYHFYNKSQSSKALSYSEKALEIFPNDTIANDVYSQLLLSSVNFNNSPQIALTKLEEKSIKYPLIKLNNRYNQALLFLYLSNAIDYFSSNNSKKGEYFLTKFENNFNTELEDLVKTGIIGKAYSSAVMHYFRMQKISKAKATAKRGLKYDKGSQELSYKLRLINENPY